MGGEESLEQGRASVAAKGSVWLDSESKDYSTEGLRGWWESSQGLLKDSESNEKPLTLRIQGKLIHELCKEKGRNGPRKVW